MFRGGSLGTGVPGSLTILTGISSKRKLSVGKVVVVQGASGVHEVPGLCDLEGEAVFRFARSGEELREALRDAEILLGWNFRAKALREAWTDGGSLRWIHWSGAGVDALLFPQLVQSAVRVTNSRGVFDRPMAEYVLGLIIAFAKHFPETWTLQSAKRWHHRLTDTIEGKKVLVVGAGSIGRTIARICSGAGMQVSGVGRSARSQDPDFGRVRACESLDEALPDADFVVIAAPLTSQTRGLFSTGQFRLMKPTARIVNVGRGAIVDEAALIAALRAKEIAGAALDVFEEEPLPEESPLWPMPNVIVSPHMSGDFYAYADALAKVFLENYRRYCAGEPLLNQIDKKLGFVPWDSEGSL